MPHFKIECRGVLDLLGPGHTLIRFDRAVDPLLLLGTGPLGDVLEAGRPAAAGFRHRLLVVRRDGHFVSWCGVRSPWRSIGS